MKDIFELLNSRKPKAETPTGPVTHIIVGLGNMGKQYEHTRHNVGFDALDTMADKLHASVDRAKFKAITGEAMIGGKRVLLMKPTTFMNLSGEAVKEAVSFYKIPPENVIVISDDVSMEVGRIRIRAKGSDGGHNGLKNIILHLGSNNFPRLRIGVGQKPHPDYDLADWVLGKFPADDRKILEEKFENVLPACEKIIAGDIAGAMNSYNK